MLFWPLCYKIAKLGEFLQKSKISHPNIPALQGEVMLQRAKKLSTVNCQLKKERFSPFLFYIIMYYTIAQVMMAIL